MMNHHPSAPSLRRFLTTSTRRVTALALSVATLLAAPALVLAQQPNTLVHTLTEPSVAAESWFGSGLAASQKWVATALVNDNTGATHAGKVVIYDLTSANPAVPAFTILNPNPTAEAGFGHDIALDGNLLAVASAESRIIGGEFHEFAGAIHIYDLASATPSVPVRTIRRTDGRFMGDSLALSGTRLAFTNGRDSGDCHVVDLASANPETPFLTIPNGQVAMEGQRLCVFSDKIYVYDLAGATPAVPTHVVPKPFAETTNYSFAFSGNRIVVGGYFVDHAGIVDSGATVVYDLTSSTPTVPVLELQALSYNGYSYFGYQVAIDGDRVLVSSPRSHYYYPGVEGVTYVYDLSSPTPQQPIAALPNPGSFEANAAFGQLMVVKGTTAVIAAPYQDTTVEDAGAVYVYGPGSDFVTQPPTLTSPVAGSLNGANFQTSFTLPEAAFAKSLRLIFTAGSTSHEITLAASEETAGAHTVSFNPANPTASAQVLAGAPIPSGTYTLTLRYQDTTSNIPALASVANVTIDATAPVIQLPPPPVVFATGPTGAIVHFAVTATDTQDTTPTLTVTPASGSLFPLGETTVTAVAQDDAGNVTTNTFTVTVTAQPFFTSVSASAQAVPGAGTPGGLIPSGAKWTSFGPPALNEAGQIAYIGNWKAGSASGKGIFVDNTVITKVGAAVPGIAGTTFKTLKDPVIDDQGRVAFIATIAGTGVTTANETVVVSSGRTGALEVLAREGSAAPGTGSAAFTGFTSVSMQGSPASGTLFTATLRAASGVPATTTATDTGVWWQPAGSAPVLLALREGGPGFLPGETVKTFQVLQALGGSPGQGRGQLTGNRALLQVGLSTGAQAQVLAQPGSLTDVVRTGDVLGGATLPGAIWNRTNLPSAADDGSSLAVLGMLKAGAGGVTSANSTGILASTDSGATWNPVARVGFVAPGMGGTAKFTSLKDPVHSSTDASVAFAGVARGGTVTTASDDAIWWQPAGNPLTLIAREGSNPPGSPVGAAWKSFTSLALPGGATGPIFTSMLTAGPGGVTTANDLVLHATDSTGVLVQLLREGHPLLGKTVKNFDVLEAVAGSAGVGRTYNAQGQIATLVTFTDNTTAIVRIDVP